MEDESVAAPEAAQWNTVETASAAAAAVMSDLLQQLNAAATAGAADVAADVAAGDAAPPADDVAVANCQLQTSTLTRGCRSQTAAVSAVVETVCGVLVKALLHPSLLFYAELLQHPLVHSLFLHSESRAASRAAVAASTAAPAAAVNPRALTSPDAAAEPACGPAPTGATRPQLVSSTAVAPAAAAASTLASAATLGPFAAAAADANAVCLFLQLHTLLRLFSTGSVRDYCRLRRLQQQQQQEQWQHMQHQQPTPSQAAGAAEGYQQHQQSSSHRAHHQEEQVLVPALPPALRRKLCMQTIIRHASHQRQVSLSSLSEALSFVEELAARPSRSPHSLCCARAGDSSQSSSRTRCSSSRSHNGSEGCGSGSSRCSSSSEQGISGSCSSSSTSEMDARLEATVEAAAAELPEPPLLSLEEQMLLRRCVRAGADTEAAAAGASDAKEAAFAVGGGDGAAEAAAAAGERTRQGAAEDRGKGGVVSISETELLVLACMQAGWLEGRLDAGSASSHAGRAGGRMLRVDNVAACDSTKEDLLAAAVVLESLEKRAASALQVLDRRVAAVKQAARANRLSSSRCPGGSSSRTRCPWTSARRSSSSTADSSRTGRDAGG